MSSDSPRSDSFSGLTIDDLKKELDRSEREEAVLLAAHPQLTSFVPPRTPTIFDPGLLAYQFIYNAEERDLIRLRAKKKEIQLELIRQESKTQRDHTIMDEILAKSPEVAKRLAIIYQSLQENRKMSTEDLCKRLDSAEYPAPIPGIWTSKFKDVTDWQKAYRKSELKNDVQSLISKAKTEIRRLTGLPHTP